MLILICILRRLAYGCLLIHFLHVVNLFTMQSLRYKNYAHTQTTIVQSTTQPYPYSYFSKAPYWSTTAIATATASTSYCGGTPLWADDPL